MNNQQAIDRLLKHMEWGWSEETTEAIELGIQALKENTWIPCSERLPEESGLYIVSVYDEVARQHFCRCEWFFFNHIYYGEAEWRELKCYEKVVAWMPLLDPYKGE